MRGPRFVAKEPKKLAGMRMTITTRMAAAACGGLLAASPMAAEKLEAEKAVPLGKAALRRGGSDVALVSLGVGVHRCLQAAQELAGSGIDATVLDLRSVAPLDRDAVVEHARRTGRVVVVDEDYIRGGLTGEIAAVLLEADIAARYARVAVEGTIPFAPHLEYAALPNVERIVTAAKGLE